MKTKFDKFDKSGTKVLCQECGQAYIMLSPAHLKKHGITFGEYQLKYPGYPTSGAAYSASYAHKNSVLFKDKENLPVETTEVKSKPIKDVKRSFELPHEQKNKQDILNYLVDSYPFIENNYIIEKSNIQGHLEYKFVVDMADPIRKTVFDFSNAYWHNRGQYPDHSRNLKLKDDNWIVITVTSHYPTIIDVKEYTDNIRG